MKISHSISSIDISTGGPARSVTHLISSLAQIDSNLQLALHTSKSADPIIQQLSAPNAKLSFYATGLLGGFQGFKKQLQILPPDLLHGHCLWQQPVHQMAQYAQQQRIPYIITPRGMLEPWSLTQSKLKKQLALKLFQAKDLEQAACLHATAGMEAKNIRALGFKNPIAVIPNGIVLEGFPLKEEEATTLKKTLLFLSRIHPKKGIEILIEAWNQTDKSLRDNWQIEIAGNGEENYITSLQRLIEAKGLQQEIKIIGPQFGEAKLAAYHRADLFVLPTHSENFGIVVVEALACGVPVITTKGTPWEELNTYRSGWWIDIGVEPLKLALNEALALTDHERQDMGVKGRKLVEEKYSIQAVAQQMMKLYKWVLGGGEKPPFVSLK